jgi:response regulator RpfG family c-di-GMP phosphodiesterase
MTRPCFLVIDREFAGSISTRKLVIETAKFNVITAYSSEEAIETLKRFPTLDGVVVDAGMTDMPCAELVKRLKQVKPDVSLIAVGAPHADYCDGVQHHLDSFNPAKLLHLLQGLKPEQTQEIEKRNEELSRENIPE